MVIARLLAVGLLSATLGGTPAQGGRLPASKLVVEAMHLKWPDGSWVESGGENDPTDIYVVDPGGKHLRNLTHDAWTNYLIDRLPNGRILYESVPSDRMRTGRSRIFSIKSDGSGRRQLASGKGQLLPKLAPDGRRILFVRGRWLYVMRSDGTNNTPLARTSFGPQAPEGYDASWSPDGKRIAFVRDFETRKAYSIHTALYVINADGTGLRRLTALRPPVKTSNPEWSPDGREIGFDEYRISPTTFSTPSDGTYVMRADGTHLKHLKQLNSAADWFWLPNDRIVYDPGNGRVRSIAADGTGKPQRLHGPIRIGGHVRLTSGRWAAFVGPGPHGSWPLSPDGKWIAVTPGEGSTRAVRSLWIAHLDGTHLRLVTRKICCLAWSYNIEWAGK
jgi:dipeptidyl aminopeptidase/acylaminoacyl peptidase